MLRSASNRQLVRWRAYDLLEQVGFPAMERRHDVQCRLQSPKSKPGTFAYRSPIRPRKFLTKQEIRARVLAAKSQR